jgi:hypothetical protein
MMAEEEWKENERLAGEFGKEIESLGYKLVPSKGPMSFSNEFAYTVDSYKLRAVVFNVIEKDNVRWVLDVYYNCSSMPEILQKSFLDRLYWQLRGKSEKWAFIKSARGTTHNLEEFKTAQNLLLTYVQEKFIPETFSALQTYIKELVEKPKQSLQFPKELADLMGK